MGGCFSVSLSCDKIADDVCQWFCLKASYVHNLPQNLSNLEDAMKNLQAKRDDVQRRVDREEFAGRQHRLAQVQVWLNDISTIEKEVNNLLSTKTKEIQRLCLCSCCSKSFNKSYIYGTNVIMKLKEVGRLDSRGEFDVVTEAVPVAQAEELPIQPIIVGHETLLERVWNRLMEDEVGIVGLYGEGGVGKTTLLTKINNKFTKTDSGFKIVIWIVVSKGTTIDKIQVDIGKKLEISGEWDGKNEKQRAIEIHNVLRKKNFVLLFDDIWEKMNLEAVGIPNPSEEKKCKVVFTTRFRNVCGRMGVHDPIEVTCLKPDKAWELFQKKVGMNTLGSHRDIYELAKTLSNKCRGLPLALNMIGETMTCKTTIEEWHQAIDDLSSTITEFTKNLPMEKESLPMENETLPILKYSYDNLSGENVKLCFLYFSLFPQDYEIHRKSLIEYWIGEGFIDEKQGIKAAINEGYEILGTLIRAGLLLDGSNNKMTVSMHDVVHDMALWISSDLGKLKDRYITPAGVDLHELPKVKDWKVVKRMSLTETKIKKIVDCLECPQLTTLLLNRNFELVKISGEFFQSMNKLLVLDLSMNGKLHELPKEISKLVSLRYLDLSGTKIQSLPLGLLALKMLIHLDLQSTTMLKSLQGISNLSSLKVIRLLYSKLMLDTSLMKELELLEDLESLSINVPSSMIGEKWFYDSKVGRCIEQLSIRESYGDESVKILIFPTLINLSHVEVYECGMLEMKIEKTIQNESMRISQCFLNLSSVTIYQCNGVKDLSWLMFAPNLTRLNVSNSKKVETIISEEKAASLVEMEDETCKIIPFLKLEVLELWYLDSLKSVYWSSLPFPCLTKLVISDCEDLKKLPLNSQSVGNVEEFVITYKDQSSFTGFAEVEDLEWEDEATKLRFLPCFK